MARLGDLERAVMDVLWADDAWITAREVGRQLHHDKRLAYTTVLTVLDRLERKGFVQRERAGRAHRYRAVDSREKVVAEAMLEALDTADDRGSALVRFVGSVTPEEAEVLRRALALGDTETPAGPPEHAGAATGTGDGDGAEASGNQADTADPATPADDTTGAPTVAGVDTETTPGAEAS